MSKWTHLICEECWEKKNPDREPVKLRREFFPFEEAQACCFCGQPTWQEIYVRHDWRELRCNGECNNG